MIKKIRETLRLKYRIVDCQIADDHWCEVQKWSFPFWCTQGSEDVDPLGFCYSWQPYKFKNKEAAEKYIQSQFKPRRTNNTPIYY